MKLLTEAELEWSHIVANSRMNRDRNATGVNSYQQEFKFNLQEFLLSRIRDFDNASWIDLCCGSGKALLQTATYFQSIGLHDKIKLKGIDLVEPVGGTFPVSGGVEFEYTSVVNWQPHQRLHLITCVHGLHYLGDKLKLIETAINTLTPSGLFIANLDLNDIRINEVNTEAHLKKIFKQMDITYHSRRKILERKGFAKVKFNLKFIGADDASGPNYTGQDAVTSYYEL